MFCAFGQYGAGQTISVQEILAKWKTFVQFSVMELEARLISQFSAAPLILQGHLEDHHHPSAPATLHLSLPHTNCTQETHAIIPLERLPQPPHLLHQTKPWDSFPNFMSILTVSLVPTYTTLLSLSGKSFPWSNRKSCMEGQLQTE